jgi:L-cysteine S-thiosulfotransferase
MDRSGRQHHSCRGTLTGHLIRGCPALFAVAYLGAADLCQADPTVPAARSGYEFLSPDTRRLQDDDFANPGMLWVETGRGQWAQPDPASGKSCQGCHGSAKSLGAVAAHYPKYSAAAGRVINLEQQINRCRSEHLRAAPWPYESENLLALTSYLSHLAKRSLVEVVIDGNAAESFARGKQIFYQRRGQLNLSCANCHEQHVGARLHGETISQGQINGFPIYRQLWQTLGSTHRMFAWCNQAVRAEPYAPGSQQYVDLELYERWRGRGLKVESPAVRR